MTKYNLPRASAKNIKETIKAHYRTTDEGDQISIDDAAEEGGPSGDLIRRQNKFLAEIGALQKDGRSYLLSETGSDIGRGLIHNREDSAKEDLRQCLLDWQLTKQLVNDIGADTEDKEGLRSAIAFLMETELDSPRKRTGTNGLIDLYEWTDIFEVDDGDYKISEKVINGSEQGLSSDLTATEADSEPENMASDNSQSSQSMIGNGGDEFQESQFGDKSVQFNIKLEVSPDDDQEQVQKMIEHIRECLSNEDNVLN